MLRLLDRLVDLVFLYPRRLGWRIDFQLRVERFRLEDGHLIGTQGLRPPDQIPLDSIRSWQVQPEMCFDIVDIELADGQVVRWLDCYNDLLSALNQGIPDRKK